MFENGHRGTTTAKLVAPYGGSLVNLVAAEAERGALLKKAKLLPSIQISLRSLADLELMAVGAFSPLDRFMGKEDYQSVLRTMRLANGTLFPIPLTLPVDSRENLACGQEITLRSPTNELVAVMRIDEIYEWNRDEEARAVLGTGDSRHPLVAEMHTWGRYYLSGPLSVLNLPRYYDFPELRRTPAEARRALETMGYSNVVAFQPRHPMHRAQEELTKRTIESVNGTLFIHPVVGRTTGGEVDHYTRVRCYRALVENGYYDSEKIVLSLLPLLPRMAGPRAGIWHGIINRNYGANYCIIGKDRVRPGKDSHGNFFYDSLSVQKLFREHEEEIGVRMIPFKEMLYHPDEKTYHEVEKFDNETHSYIKVWERRALEEARAKGGALPDWFTRPEVARILQDVKPPRSKRGVCIWLTGLPSSGKSTIADILAPMLMATGRKITVLDGDVVRTHLTKGLGFSMEDRITNILRVGFVASEVVRHNGTAICALISPYTSARDKVRSMFGEHQFIEVYVDTPVEECERRDVKGLYTQAKKGIIKGFTGVDDAYEPPAAPEISINTVEMSPEESARKILGLLQRSGFVETTNGHATAKDSN